MAGVPANPPSVKPLPSGWTAYYRIVRRIPRGRVATYGQIALLAGRPRAARQVGFAMAALRGTRHRVPWQRVLGARPRGAAAVSILDPMGAAVQRVLLEREGVAFDAKGRVSLERFGWRPRRRRPEAAERPAGLGPSARVGRRPPPRARSEPGRRRHPTRRRRDHHQSMGLGPTRQISSAYSRMVRSEEKRPVRATLRTAMRVQRS